MRPRGNGTMATAARLDSLKVGIIGMGKMGEALALGLQRRSPAKKLSIAASTRSKESAADASRRLGIACSISNAEVARASDVLVLCVKPYQAEAVCREIAPALAKKQLLISVCASVTNANLAEWTGKRCSVIRVMPNTPALVGEGMTVLTRPATATEAHLALARAIFESVGKTEVVEEPLFDGVTGLSGCGPAYAYLVIEALSEAGVKVGIPRDVATRLAAQTLLGAAKMVLSSDAHPAALKDEVTTPAGCTIDGLMALEEGKLRVTLIKAVLAATRRSKTLARND